MNLPTMQKDKGDFYQQFFEEEVSQPLVKKNPTAMIAESQENNFIKKYGKRIVSNLLIWGGGWMLFSSSSMFVHLTNRLPIENPLLKILPYLFIGFALLFFGIGKIKKKSGWLLFTIFPLMGCLFGFLLRLETVNWWRDGNFLSGLLFSFFAALLMFYYIRDYFGTSDS
jgi:hypothetical protein